ncbi:MAG: permease [Acidobacteriaceae bacterium]
MTSFFNWRVPSLLRGNLLSLVSLAISFPLAKFPLDQANPAMVIPIVGAAAGMAETFRCIRMRWSWYHGAVLMSLYMDTLILTMILFLALYPLLMRIG